MQVPLEISYKNVPKNDNIEALIREKAAKLEQICDYMISCRVTVEKPQESQSRGNPYYIRIVMRIPPQHELVIKRESSKGDMHDPLVTVIRDVFSGARRQLKELVEKQRGDIKAHPKQEIGAVVSNMFPEEGYGFIRAADTQDEIYFHRNSVLHGNFENIKVGSGVRFVLEQGEKGPQASTVELVEA